MAETVGFKLPCHDHELRFRHQTHGNRNSAERAFREAKRRTTGLSNYFTTARVEIADGWIKPFAFGWNQLI